MSTDTPARKPSPSALTDAPWTILAPLIPAAHAQDGGRPREVDLRAVVNPLLDLTRRGCQWEMLPHDGLPQSTVYDDLARGRADGTGAPMLAAWREQTRRHAGREPTPSAAGLDRPAVQPTERGGAARGADGGKQVKGRQRHLVGDPLGLVRVVLITRAGVDAGVAAPQRLQRLEPKEFPRLDTRFADNTDHHQALHTGMTDHRPMWRIEVKTRPEGAKGFTPLEKRGVGERTNAWHGRSRRPSKDDERTPESSGAMLSMSHSHLMRRRLTSHGRPACHDRRVTADARK